MNAIRRGDPRPVGPTSHFARRPGERAGSSAACTPEANPLSARSPRLVALFQLYLHWFFWRRFHAVRLSRSGIPDVPDGRPLIVYTNHPGWWDPAIFLLVNDTLFPGRAGYAPMDQAALMKYGLFRRMGIFGIERSRRGAARFLRVAAEVLHTERTSLWVTAEGEFSDPRRRPIRLQPGIAHLARRVPDAILLPLAIEYSFWNESRPEALLRAGRPLHASPDRDVAAWTTLLEEELAATMDALAAESMTRRAALFTPLLAGTAGVGGPYDLWRRLRAWSAGARFDPSHESKP